MGYYDGKDGGDECSAHALALATGTPAVLVVDAGGSAASAAAMALGFCRYRAPSGLGGALINRAGSLRHYELARAAIERETGLKCVGYLQRDEAVRLPSRHLGLVPAAESEGLERALDRLAANAEKTVDFDAILALARRAAPLDAPAPRYPRSLTGFRLGVARDEAFGFYYQANLDALRAMGANLCFFSPLRDAALPEDLDGLYLGGGFPEVFAARLLDNQALCGAMRSALAGGLRCYAECGGLLYLAMIGFLPLEMRMTGRLQHFGYVRVADEEGALTFPAHEFHHSRVACREPVPTVFQVRKGAQAWRCGYRKLNALAGYPHLHFFERPELIERLWLS